MICQSCIAAGVANNTGSPDSAKMLHQQCEGDCPCHHKTGKGWVYEKPVKKLKLERRFL